MRKSTRFQREITRKRHGSRSSTSLPDSPLYNTKHTKVPSNIIALSILHVALASDFSCPCSVLKRGRLRLTTSPVVIPSVQLYSSLEAIAGIVTNVYRLLYFISYHGSLPNEDGYTIWPLLNVAGLSTVYMMLALARHPGEFPNIDTSDGALYVEISTKCFRKPANR